MEELAQRLPQATLKVIGSIYGHDAFLKEQVALRTLFGDALSATVASSPVLAQA
jgi:homoserine acetyltransferase